MNKDEDEEDDEEEEEEGSSVAHSAMYILMMEALDKLLYSIFSSFFDVRTLSALECIFFFRPKFKNKKKHFLLVSFSV